MTKSDIAALLGISETLYTRYENGSSNIPIDMLRKIAKTLNTTIDFILGMTNVNISDYTKFDKLCRYMFDNYLDERKFHQAVRTLNSLMSKDDTVLASRSTVKSILRLRFDMFGKDYNKLNQQTEIDKAILKQYINETQRETNIQMDEFTAIAYAMNTSLNSIFTENEIAFDKWSATMIAIKYKSATAKIKDKVDVFINFVQNREPHYPPCKPIEISNTENKTLNKRLAALRNAWSHRGETGMTQSELASASECSLKTIQNYESSTYTDRASMETLVLIADKFDTSIEYIDSPTMPISMQNLEYFSKKYLSLPVKLQSEMDAFSKFIMERNGFMISKNEIKVNFANNLDEAMDNAINRKIIKDEQELAEKALIDEKTLDKYIKGETCPNLKIAKKLCKVLKVDLDYLFINSDKEIENSEIYQKLKKNFSSDIYDKLKIINSYMDYLLSTQQNDNNENSNKE